MLRSAFFALWLVAFAHANMCGIEGGCEEQADAESMKVSMLQRGTLHKETTSQRMYEEILAKRKAAIVSELSAIEAQLGEGPGGSGYNPGGGGGSGYNPGNTCFDERSDSHCPTGAGATYVDGKCCLPGPHTCFEEFKLGCPAPALFVGFIHGQCCVSGANLDCPKVWRSDCADDDIFVGTVKGNCCPGDHGGSGFNPGNGGNGGSGFNPGNGGNGGSGFNPGNGGNGGSGYNPGTDGNGGSGYNPGNGGNGGSGYNPGNGGTGGSGYNPGDTAACDAHPACARLQLEGNCCPNADGVRLGCCS